MSRRHKKHPQFEIDYQFYFSQRHQFNFCGADIKSAYQIQYPNDPESLGNDEDGSPILWAIPYSKEGKIAKECFYRLDSEGKRLPCFEPELLVELLTCKAGVNLQIKIWAEGRAEYTLPLDELMEYVEHFKCPDWVLKAVENQKQKILKEWIDERKWKQHKFYQDAFTFHMGGALQDIKKESANPDPQVILGDDNSLQRTLND